MNNDINEKIEHAAPVPPFVRFVASTVPMVFDNSLSYYEALCALWKWMQDDVVDVINNNASVTEDYIDLTNDLKTFIETYFDNLDVQAEINNKLDEMAEDGSLTRIIKEYVDPIQEAFEAEINAEFTAYKNTVNGNIATMNTKIDNITSGTPIPVSSTADMSDTTRIYLNTTDGYWYYYNGSVWTQGGVYQAVGVNTSSVTYGALDTTLKSGLEERFTDDTYTTYSRGYIGDTGQIYTAYNDAQFYISINLTGNEIFSFGTYYNTTYMGTDKSAYVVLDEDNNVLDKMGITESTAEFVTGTVSCSPLARKIIFNSNTVRSNPECPSFYILKVGSFAQKQPVEYHQLSDELKGIFEPEYEEVEGEVFIDGGYFNINQGVNNSTYYKVMKYDVTAGDMLKIEKTKNVYTNPVIFLCSKDSIYDYVWNDETYHIHYRVDWNPKPIINNESLNDDIYITVPDYCDTIYINVPKSNTQFKVNKVSRFKVDISNTSIDLSNYVTNPLNSKTLCFAGDSIIAATASGVQGIVNLLAADNPNTSFHNYAHDGYTIAKAEDEWSSRSIQNVLPTILSEHPDTNFIVFNGGANDIYGGSHGITLGEILSGYNVSNVDRTSFTGGLEYIFNYIYNNFTNTKPVFIVTHQIYSDYFRPYMDRAIEVCKKWGVPYIDLLHEGTLNFLISYMRERFSVNGDGTHPNLAGYQRILPLVENSLKYKV